MYPACVPTHFAVTLSPTVAQQALATCAGLEQLQQLPYVRAILAESLRLYPQPPILIRRALADDVLPTPLGGDPKGYPIGKGADIFISVWNLHRWDGFSSVTACNYVLALLWIHLLTGTHMPVLLWLTVQQHHMGLLSSCITSIRVCCVL